MSELATMMQSMNLPTNVNQEEQKSLMTSGDYLPFFTVMTANAELCQLGKIQPGKLAIISNQTPQDLGSEVVAVIIAKRAKAMNFGDQVMSFFDVNSPEFKDCYAARDVKNSGKQAGMEFLIWLPTVGEKGTFATLFAASKTARKEAPTLVKMVDDGCKAALIRAHFIKGTQYSWWGYQVIPHSAPIGNTPDPAEFKKQVEKFVNPKSSVVEKAENVGAERPR